MMDVPIDVGLLEGIDRMLTKFELTLIPLMAVFKAEHPDEYKTVQRFLGYIRQTRAQIREILTVAR